MKNFNANNFTYFIAVGEGLDRINRGGSISFRDYTDHADGLKRGAGSVARYVTSRDEKGKDVGKYFNLDESRRKFQVRFGEKDIHGVLQYDFMKNYPDCEGSPNGRYVEVDGVMVQQGVLFRELNTNADAKIALEAETRRSKASASALAIDNQTLQELASFIGVFGEPGEEMRMRVYEWAQKRPGDYLEQLDAGDRSLRAIVRKSIADGLLKTKGSVIYWSDTVIGADENDAIATLVRDPQMLDALQKKVKLNTNAKPIVPPEVKKKPGRPRLNKEVPKEPSKNTESSL